MNLCKRMKGKSLTIQVDHQVPSLNKLFSMNHWGRKKEKDITQLAVLSALNHSAHGFSTQTISSEVRSILSIASDTLGSFMTTGKQTSRSRSRKKKSPTKRKSKRKSKSRTRKGTRGKK